LDLKVGVFDIIVPPVTIRSRGPIMKVAVTALVVASILLTSAFVAAGADENEDKEKTRVIKIDDKLTVTIDDLQGPGVQTSVKVVVDKKGEIKLPLLNNVSAKGLTRDKLEQAIVKTYRDQNLLRQANVSVKFRGEEKESEGLRL
jgi:protein involved in polysaccharide export with SLBB domain